MVNLTRIFDQIEQIQIKSVTDSLFKYGMLILAIGGTISGFGHAPDWTLIIIFCFGGLFLLVGLAAYIYFASTKPEYLRSETHQQRMRAMDLLGDKENADNPNILHLPSITNPYVKPELGEGKKSIEG